MEDINKKAVELAIQAYGKTINDNEQAVLNGAVRFSQYLEEMPDFLKALSYAKVIDGFVLDEDLTDGKITVGITEESDDPDDRIDIPLPNANTPYAHVVRKKVESLVIGEAARFYVGVQEGLPATALSIQVGDNLVEGYSSKLMWVEEL